MSCSIHTITLPNIAISSMKEISLFTTKEIALTKVKDTIMVSNFAPLKIPTF